MDKLDAFRVLCSVVEAGGFSRAADRLSMSTSSVTKHIASLEAHFQVKLLNRTTRSMSLTDEGRRCYEYAQKILANVVDLEDSMLQTARAPSGNLRVDMPGILARLYVLPAIPAFLAKNPNISLKLTAGDRMIDMVEEGVDVLIRIGKLQDSALIAKTICETQYVTCASPEFIRRHGVPSEPSDLEKFPCLNFLYPKSRLTRPWFFRQGKEEITLTPTSRLQVDHVDSVIEAAIAGAGIVQQLSVSLREPLRTGKLVPLLLPWQTKGPDVSVIFQQKYYRAPKIKAFVSFVEKLF